MSSDFVSTKNIGQPEQTALEPTVEPETWVDPTTSSSDKWQLVKPTCPIVPAHARLLTNDCLVRECHFPYNPDAFLTSCTTGTPTVPYEYEFNLEKSDADSWENFDAELALALGLPKELFAYWYEPDTNDNKVTVRLLGDPVQLQNSHAKLMANPEALKAAGIDGLAQTRGELSEQRNGSSGSSWALAAFITTLALLALAGIVVALVAAFKKPAASAIKRSAVPPAFEQPAAQTVNGSRGFMTQPVEQNSDFSLLDENSDLNSDFGEILPQYENSDLLW